MEPSASHRQSTFALERGGVTAKPFIGCIADDFTGGTDIASMLVEGGMRTVQTIGIPAAPVTQADAVVVALKTRTAPKEQAIAESLKAARWLRSLGCQVLYFKYCSTFDSTPTGNIGPVIDALMDELGATFTIACPALPANGRTVYKGNLFVGDVPLNESGMKDHPLTPMTDANVVRLLQPQTTRRVGLVTRDVITKGSGQIEHAYRALKATGIDVAVVDAVDNADLREIAASVHGLSLLTGGSGLAKCLPEQFAKRGDVVPSASASRLDSLDAPAVVLSGSCSTATNAQVQQWLRSKPGYKIDPMSLHAGNAVVDDAVHWVAQQSEPALVYASAMPDAVKRTQLELGTEAAGQLVEQALSEIAVKLRDLGFRKFVVAGGETSGAVVKALGVTGLRIGEAIAPGVPWTQSTDAAPLSLALKSGNFGTIDFFAEALATCP